MMDQIKYWRPPAITTGLIPFFILFRLLTDYENFELTPNALFQLDLNRLSFYPLVFNSVLEMVVEIIVFTPLCGAFEVQNGTVRTGVVLNVVAVIPGALSNIIDWISGGHLMTANFCGTSSWMLALSAFLSVSSWTLPTMPVGNLMLTLPPYLLPATAYVVLTIIAPYHGLVHGLALGMGYGLGLLYLGFLVDGTTRPVEWIEVKLDRGINGLRYIVNFVGEVKARDLRRMSLVARRHTLEAVDEIPMPAASLTNPIA